MRIPILVLIPGKITPALMAARDQLALHLKAEGVRHRQAVVIVSPGQAGRYPGRRCYTWDGEQLRSVGSSGDDAA